ncbi:MAG: PAS domain-containing sensor histidine kinase [Acidimicrobiales bacterium]
MATMAELARIHTGLEDAELEHLQKLVADWGMLSDFCFADLLLFVPVAGSDGSRFVVLGQIRPTTNQTLYREDLVGRIIDEVERPFVTRAWRVGEIVEGEVMVTSPGERARLQCIPVHRNGRLLGVMTRESAPTVGRRPGELERVYVETFDRFARMIVAGEFPFNTDDAPTQDAPRVGDGVVVLDTGGRVEYASPNAVNALHRMGMYSNTEGMRLDELGIATYAIDRAFATLTPISEEIDRPDVIVAIRCIPLLEGGVVTGGVVLLRDVSDLRRRDRLLVTMDATIREVHHRVKNNLQTISSLLRLQARREPVGSGRTALEEAERRIRSIALIHEILSRETGDSVDLNEIVVQLVRVAEEGVFTAGVPVRFRVDGDGGILPADIATPLGVVLTELLTNAAEHAFPEGWSQPEGAHVQVSLHNTGDQIVVRVHDNGVGWPADFDIGRTKSLGLSIARSLVVTQLSGTLETRNDSGAVSELTIPITKENVT